MRRLGERVENEARNAVAQVRSRRASGQTPGADILYLLKKLSRTIYKKDFFNFYSTFFYQQLNLSFIALTPIIS